MKTRPTPDDLPSQFYPPPGERPAKGAHLKGKKQKTRPAGASLKEILGPRPGCFFVSLKF